MVFLSLEGFDLICLKVEFWFRRSFEGERKGAQCPAVSAAEQEVDFRWHFSTHIVEVWKPRPASLFSTFQINSALPKPLIRAALVKVRKSKAKRQAVAVTVDERKSCLSSWLRRSEEYCLLWACKWDWAEKSDEFPFHQWRRSEGGESGSWSTGVLPHGAASIVGCPCVSLTKFYQVMLGAREEKPSSGTTHSYFIFSLDFSVFCTQNECSDTHAACGAVTRLAP